jgi:hypothetical protein
MRIGVERRKDGREAGIFENAITVSLQACHNPDEIKRLNFRLFLVEIQADEVPEGLSSNPEHSHSRFLALLFFLACCHR